MDMEMSATASAAMATTTSDASSMMPMSDMAMTFFTATNTPLYSNAWMPSSTGKYAGTCIFLIVFAVIWRALIAFRPILEARFWSRGSLSVRHTPGALEEASSQDDGKGQLVPGAAIAAASSDVRRRWSGWRVGTAAARATYELLIIGMGYLLMVGVMTMNVGYFLSVLAGAWFGTFMLGSLATNSHWDHC